MKNKGLRIAEYLVTLLVIVTMNFFLPRLMPGDPFLHLSGDAGQEIVTFTKEQQEYFAAYYGLDRPLPEQYFRYLTGLTRGDLGFSYYYKDDVAAIILRRLPWTLLMVTAATLLSLILGIVLGSYSAWRRESWQDKATYLFMIIFSEIPAFLLGIMFLILFAAALGLFPLSGGMTHFAGYTGWEKVKDILHHAALPVITLSLARSGGIFLLVRNTLTTVLGKDYMRTARAKGLTKRRIRYRHAMKNALLPLVTRVALQLGGMVGGAVLVENVFAYPGLGRLMRDAVFVRDYPLLQGIFLVLAFGVLAANLLADLLYRTLDPRTREGELHGKQEPDNGEQEGSSHVLA